MAGERRCADEVPLPGFVLWNVARFQCHAAEVTRGHIVVNLHHKGQPVIARLAVTETTSLPGPSHSSSFTMGNVAPVIFCRKKASSSAAKRSAAVEASSSPTTTAYRVTESSARRTCSSRATGLIHSCFVFCGYF